MKRNATPGSAGHSGRALETLARVRRLEEEERLELIQERKKHIRALEKQVEEIERRRQRVARGSSGDVLANRKLAETLYLLSARIRRELAAGESELDARMDTFRSARARRSVIDRLSERKVLATSTSRRRRAETDLGDDLSAWRHGRAPR